MAQDKLASESYSKLADSKLASESYSKLADSKLASESYSKLADSKLASAASKRHDYFELEPTGLQSSADRMSFKMETKETESVGGEDSIEGAGGCEGSVCSEEVPIKRNVEDAQTTKKE